MNCRLRAMGVQALLVTVGALLVPACLAGGEATDAVDGAWLADASNAFGFALFRAVTEASPGANTFVSPTSVSMALAMTANGAAGTTREAMAGVLRLDQRTSDELNIASRALSDTLKRDPGGGVELTIANSLWSRLGFPFSERFVETNERYYGARLTEIDFNDPGSVDVINGWVSEATKSKIDAIVDHIPADAMLYLINAIYFDGAWAKPFDKAATKERPFTLLDGSRKMHPMMSQDGRYRYLKGDGFEAVALPYGDEGMSMYVFLPDETSSLSAFLGMLTPERWTRWMEGFRKTSGTIVLPRFTVEYGVELGGALKSLGMGIAFDPTEADFSLLSPVPLYIGRVKHKTFVKVDEEGTEAAAVTSVEMRLTAVRPSQTFSMVVDRPFFCAIRDEKTGAVLFMGSIFDPS